MATDSTAWDLWTHAALLAQAEGGPGGEGALQELIGAEGGGEGAGAAPGGAGGGGTQAPPSLFQGPFLLIFVVLGFMILMSIMSGRKEKKKRSEMMASLKRGDRVQTIGGVIGEVAEISGDELVLRVDELSKTRIRFSRSAIQQVLRSSGSESDDAGASNGALAEKAAV